MKIIFLSRWFPFPANNGSKLRIHNFLRGLSQRHEVTLLSFADQARVDSEAPVARGLCSEACVVPWKEFNPRSVSAQLGFFSLKPRSLVDTFSDEMTSLIKEKIQGGNYDLVIASQLPMAAYYPYFDRLPAIFDELELGLSVKSFNGHPGGARQLRDAATWFKLRQYLRRLLPAFHAVTVVSGLEKDILTRYFPQIKHIAVIPNSINLADYMRIPSQPQANQLVFTGSFRYRVNYDAMVWFVGEVFPHILRQLPDTQLLITGDHLDLTLPSRKNVQRTGQIEDIKELIASSAVSLAPLRQGGGTRLKILEAMALRTPVVATSKGAEGLGVGHGEHLLIADDPVGFSNCVISLLQDATLRRTITERALRFVQQEYDCEKAVRLLLDLVDSVHGEGRAFR